MHSHAHAQRQREELTAIPSNVLKLNKYKKLPVNCMTVSGVTCTENFWIALKSTIDVASFTTPSPKTRLYNRGVSS